MGDEQERTSIGSFGYAQTSAGLVDGTAEAQHSAEDVHPLL